MKYSPLYYVEQVREYKKGIEALGLITTELASATSLNQISRRILKIIATTFDWEIGALWLIPDGGNMKLIASWPRTNNKLVMSSGRNLAARAYLHSEGIWKENARRKTSEDRKKILEESAIKSTFMLPIESNNKLIGVMEFFDSRKRKRDESTITILNTIKYHIGQVLEKQRIVEENDLVHKQLQSIFMHAPTGITVEDGKGRILNANKEFSVIFDSSEDSLAGTNMRQIFDKYRVYDMQGIQMSFSDRPARKVLNGEADVTETLAFINKVTESKRYILIRATRLEQAGSKKPLVVKSFKDVTQMIEEQRQNEFFIGVVSHELKSPLASIKAYAHLTQRRVVGDSKVLSYLESINSQTDRVTSIINDIFDVNKLLSGRFELNKRVFNLDRVLEKIVQNFQLITPTHKIITKGGVGVELELDEDRFAQLVLNLLTNAVKYSPKGKKIEIYSKVKKGFVLISVKDYGIGIPKKHHKDIFKLYKIIPTKGKIKHGLGMGLAIAKGIAKAHLGDITLESSAGNGAEFIVKLPISNEKK